MASAKGNLTAVQYGINDIRLEQRPIPTPGDNDVLLRMASVGICGSDVHYLTRGAIGPFVLKAPMVIGHESSGTVEAVGAKVKHLKPGDRVAIEPGVPCRTCAYCKEGRYNLCPEVVFCATPPVDGNLGQYYVHAADFCYKLPDHVSFDEGALLEPLSVGVHGCKRAGITVGSTVLVLGAGPIGLVTMMCAKAFGASKVLIADITEHRLEVARTLGADHVFVVNKSDEASAVAAAIVHALGREPDVTMDCCGAEQMVQVALRATRAGGVAVLIGMGDDTVTLPLTSALIREVDIRGIFRYANDYPTALELVASGKVNVKPLITHHFSITETAAAFDTAVKGLGNPIKIMIHASPNWREWH